MATSRGPFGLNEDQGFRSMGGARGGYAAGGSGGGDPLAGDRIRAASQERTAGANNTLQKYLAGQSDATARYVADQRAATDREGNQLQYNASVLPANQKMERYNATVPYFQNTFAAMNQEARPVGRAPGITVGGVYDEGQIQQQVNAARAGNDQKTGGDVSRMRADVGGRGFGSNSPLALALESNMHSQNLAANTSSERETRMGAAKMNSDQLLASQTAAEGQYSSRQQEEIERKKAHQSALGTWLGAFGSMV
jgi:hypothetical protein